MARSLAAGSREQQDAGARSLALRYAALLDAPSVEQKYAKPLRLVAEAVGSTAERMPANTAQQLLDSWERIVSALAEQTTASDLGPKLLATLTALGCTPAGRSEKGGKGGTVTQHPASAGLSLLRGNSERRNGAAG